MKFRTFLTAAAILLLSLSASAATLIVPAAGTGPGAFDSHWQSELTLHNASPRSIEVSVALHHGTSVAGPVTVGLTARQTLSIADIVKTRFGLESGAGALVIEVADRDARGLAVTSRVANVFAGGEYGQDIPSMPLSAALGAGEIGAIPGPSKAAGNRLNFGIYAVEDTTVTWQLVRADGTLATPRQGLYAAGQHVQYGNGLETFLSGTPADNDTVYGRIESGRAIVYGSIVNETGDPTWVPATRTRDDILIFFQGLDLDENGSVDVPDLDGDGVLDTPLVVYTSMYPSYSRIAAAGEFGESVTFEVVSSPDATVTVSGATLIVTAAGNVKNTSGQIVVKAISGNSSTTFSIPVLFK